MDQVGFFGHLQDLTGSRLIFTVQKPIQCTKSTVSTDQSCDLQLMTATMSFDIAMLILICDIHEKIHYELNSTSVS